MLSILVKQNNVQRICRAYSVPYNLRTASSSIFISTYSPCLPWSLPPIVHSHQNLLYLQGLFIDPPCYPELSLFRSWPDKLFIILQVSDLNVLPQRSLPTTLLTIFESHSRSHCFVIFVFYCICHLKLSCLMIYLLLYSFIICFSC